MFAALVNTVKTIQVIHARNFVWGARISDDEVIFSKHFIKFFVHLTKERTKQMNYLMILRFVNSIFCAIGVVRFSECKSVTTSDTSNDGTEKLARMKKK